MERTKKKNQNTAVETETLEENAAVQKLEAEEDATIQEPEPEEDATIQEPEEEDKATDVFDILPNPCVYCGPSIRGVTRQYTIYQGGGLPDPLKEIIKEYPKIKELIVPAGEFQAMRRRLDTPGTPEANLYKAIREALTRGRSV